MFTISGQPSRFLVSQFVCVSPPQGLEVSSGERVNACTQHCFCLLFPTSLCGVLVFDSVSRLHLRLLVFLCRARSLSHTIFATPSFTTQLCTPVSHTTSSHAIFHHTIFHTQLCHNFAHTQLCHTPSFTSLCLAGVALGDIHHHFVWQAWHLVTSTFVSRSRCVTHNLPPRHLSHTTLSHTIFHHTIFLTQPCTPLSHTTSSHTIFHHTIFHTQLCTHTHTCSEQSLRILIWNASYVQKQSSYT